MNTEILQQKINKGESENLEFKSKMIPPIMLNKIVNSMVNTKGGEIIIGVNDSGNIEGVDLNKDYLKRNKDQLIIRGINDQNSRYKQYVKITTQNIKNKNIVILDVRRKKIRSIANSDGHIYKRINDLTVVRTNKKNYYKSVEISRSIKKARVPEFMNPGDEIVLTDALVLNPHKTNLKIKYKYDENDIKVFGPYQDETNVINVEKENEETKFHLKFCANKDIRRDCSKQLYIIVEELIEKKWPYILSKIVLFFLVFISLLPLAKNIFDAFNKESLLNLQILNVISIPLPLFTIFSIVLLSNRIDKILNRLSLIKIESIIKYQEKHIGGKTIIKGDNIET